MHPITPTTPGPISFNQAAFASNAQTLASHNADSVIKQVNHTPVVLVPPLSAGSRPSEYVTFQDDQVADDVKKGRIGEASLTSLSLQTQEQKAVVDQASDNLQTLIQEIFEADDQTGDDPSTVAVTGAAECFVWVDHDDAQVLTLAPATLVKLDSLLQKAIAVGRASDIPINDLCRLQDLCEKSLTTLQSSELSIDTAWSGDDFAAWIQRVAPQRPHCDQPESL